MFKTGSITTWEPLGITILHHDSRTYWEEEMYETVEGYKDDEDEHHPCRSTNQAKAKVDGSNTQNLSWIANKPMEPIKDWPTLVCGTASAQCHEGLDETQAWRDIKWRQLGTLQNTNYIYTIYCDWTDSWATLSATIVKYYHCLFYTQRQRQ